MTPANLVKIVQGIVEGKCMFRIIAFFQKLKAFVQSKIVESIRRRTTMPIRVVIDADNHVVDQVLSVS